MDFKQLESLTAVARESSFTKAAEKLFLSQPTVSTHIRALEEELGVRLIRRTTKNVELTEQGREVCEYAENILDLRRRMVRACEETEGRSLHLGVSTIPSAYILPEVLPDFLKKYPDTQIELKQDDSQGIMDRLREGVFDVGLVGMRTDDRDLSFEPFCKDHLIFITPAEKRFRDLVGKEDVLRDLLAEPMILREKGSGSRTMAGRFLKMLGVEEEDLKVIARINDQETIKQLVASGMGVSVISERAARGPVRAGMILAFEFPQIDTDRELYVVTRRQAQLSAAARRFIRFLTGYFAGERED